MTLSHKTRQQVLQGIMNGLNLTNFTNEIDSSLRCDLATMTLRTAKRRVPTGLSHYSLARSAVPGTPNDRAVDKTVPHYLGDQYGINGLDLKSLISLPRNKLLRKVCKILTTRHLQSC